MLNKSNTKYIDYQYIWKYDAILGWIFAIMFKILRLSIATVKT